jgi:DNA-binding NarL/FixJ family response regulator
MSEKIARHKQPWKPEELQKLQVLAGKGKGLKEIAKALNRTEESTKDAARSHGFTIAKLR